MSETPTVYWPNILLSFNYTRDQAHKTLVKEALPGNEQRRPLYLATGVKYYAADTTYLNQTDRQTLYDFFNARRGMFESFWFFEPITDSFTVLKVGVGDGATSIFLLPLKGTTITTAYVNGVSHAFTIAAGVGAGGEDRLTFTLSYVPALNTIITVTGTGQRRVAVRFNVDRMPEKLVGTNQYMATRPISLKEVV